MDRSELLAFLFRSGQDLGCAEIALRLDCENLETVYVLVRSGELLVTDRGETFQYLERSGDETYEQISVADAREICHQYGVAVDDRRRVKTRPPAPVEN